MGIKRLRLSSLFLFLLSFSASYGQDDSTHKIGIPEKLARVDGKKQVNVLEAKLVNAKYKGNPSKAVDRTNRTDTVNTTELTKYNILNSATARVSASSNPAAAYDNLLSLEREYSFVGLTEGSFSSAVPGAASLAAGEQEPVTTHQVPLPIVGSIPLALPVNQKDFERFKSDFISEASDEMNKLAVAANNQRNELKKVEEANRKTEKEAQDAEREIAKANKEIDDQLKKKQEEAKKAASDKAGKGAGDQGKGAKEDDGDNSLASQFGEGTPKPPATNGLFDSNGDSGSNGFDAGAFTGGLGNSNSNSNPGGLPDISLPNSSGNNLLKNLLGQNQTSNYKTPDLGSKTPGNAITNNVSPFRGAPQEPPAPGGAVKGPLGSASSGSAPDVSASPGGKYASYNPFKTYAVGNDGPGASEEAGGPNVISPDEKNMRKGNSEIFYSSDSDGNRPRGILESFVGKVRFLCSDTKNKERIGVCSPGSASSVRPNNGAILSAITDLPL